jgi:HAE1 family hydrophobic/amphiphilic exporter-1
MHPIEASVRNPVKVSVGILMLALFGTIALIRMPMQLTPEVQTPTITVDTRWTGASPQEVEREIVQEQEEQLKSVEGLTKLSSESKDSQGTITLEFEVGTDIEAARNKVANRLQQVPEYPEDAKEPVISTANSSDRPIAWFILSTKMPDDAQIAEAQEEFPQWADELQRIRDSHNEGLAMLRLRNLFAEHPEAKEKLKQILPPDIDVETLRKFTEDEIEARFEKVPGVAQSNVIGGRDPELQVIVHPYKLAARKLTIMDVRRRLRGENIDISGGDFDEGKRRYVVRTLGRFRSPEQVENQILAIREGRPVYVRDVAEVKLGYKKSTGLVRRFGSTSIACNVVRKNGANVLDVMERLGEVNQDLNETLLNPRGLHLSQVYDETEYIYSAVGLVNQNIVVGGLLTIAVLLIFLRSGRSSLVIAMAIPSSIIGTFLVLHLLGRSLNVISLAGLAFAVGMLVDNAVVVLENIYRHYQAGMPRFKAAVRGTIEVWGAVVASTLTTLAVFLPVLFVQEQAGQLFRDIALAISSAVALSLIISVTLIPTAAARLLRKRRGEDDSITGSSMFETIPSETSAQLDANGEQAMRDHAPNENRLLNKIFAPLDRVAAAFVSGVVGFVAWVQLGLMRRVTLVLVLVGASVLLSWALWPKVEYLPTGNRNLVFGIVIPPPGYNLDKMKQMGELVETELRPYWDVDPDSEEAAELEFPPIGDFFYVARNRQVFLGVRAHDAQRAAQLVPLVQMVRSKLSDGSFLVAKQSSLFEQGLTAGRTIELEITGEKLEKLVELGAQVLVKVMQLIPEAQVRPIPSLDLSSPEVHVATKSFKAGQLDFTTEDIGYSVNALIDGAYATDYFIGADKIDLVILGNEDYVHNTQDVEQLPIATPNGNTILLKDIATVELGSGPEQVNHRERQRSITIEVTPPPTMALEDALGRIQEEVITPLRESGQLAGGYRITPSGTADKLLETWEALRWNIVLALIITYLLMAALFESWLYPMVIIFTVPLGAVGGIIGLKLLSFYLLALGQPPQSLDVLTMLGFVILIGTVVNNAILIVHQSLIYMRDEGSHPNDAILASVRTRIRPIFMTTTTTVLGLSPLVFFPGAGSELYRGLGAVVLGGLLMSTIFTLFLVPTVFSLTMDAKAAVARWFRPTPTNQNPPSPTPQPEPVLQS